MKGIPESSEGCSAAGYRVLPILDHDGKLIPGAHHVIWGITFWPEDEFTAKHAAEIRQSYLMGDGDIPDAAKWVKSAANKKREGYFTAGVLALNLISGALGERPTSGRKTIDLYVRMVNKNPAIANRTASSYSAAQKAFRDFKSVAHIAAAGQMVSAGHYDPKEWAEGTTTVEVMLSYAAQFQMVLMNLDELGGTAIQDWNPWLVPPELCPFDRPILFFELSDEAKLEHDNYRASPNRGMV